MSSRKTERLINLTIALLATRRYLTKSDIFRTIEGYAGSAESKERMFERDKDELRAIGIVIEVGGLDPLFDDEPGYRIRPEEYNLNLGPLTGREIALLSLAAQAWKGAALSASAQTALLKLNSLGIQSDFDAIPSMAPHLNISFPSFGVISKAIANRNPISFVYIDKDLLRHTRRLHPFGIGNRGGRWYLVGRDLDKNEERTFRLDRIEGEVIIRGEFKAFEVPSEFSLVDFLHNNIFEPTDSVLVAIRHRKGHVLRQQATSITPGEDFDTCHVPFSNLSQLVDVLLWHGNDVVVISPDFVRREVIHALEDLVEKHHV